ncbi:NADPH-dependent F420 reductase [Pseudomonadales bacterium]|mgnify:FL=1|jgi:NADPH-dependent F420 reductase|nr:NADPH-dependent F420 reductase [Gammaproteobacteria bacterium]MDA7773769.1 NADPH-dependent F420 reductase [Pseudomonadales bacterium]MDC0994615.1 NADPH-dependent F420 reductase [Pseudomonadales bacterium]MDG1002489.1 NADPH-dependent F420 reductase [Pseudomonadales bacterium]MDG1304097.1 NADPH-dependent F420 reductase [Pseudomonadales bacterium]|tara:strand:+ start:2688 stop:3371 length:684 start_codon:yes stop_codon:yes gene_type:complete
MTTEDAANTIKSIAILGGTGDLGGGLARQWSRAGYQILIGSRTEEKGKAAAEDLLAEFPDLNVTGHENLAAATAADLVVLTVPFAHQISTLESVKSGLVGKVLIDVTVPLMPPKVGTVQMPEAGCAAVMAQACVGDDVSVVSAFQNVGAMHLQEDHAIECDVLVTGNKKAARDTVISLIEALGLRGWHAGPLANAAAAEALTSVLISINRHHKINGAGIVITGESGS